MAALCGQTDKTDEHAPAAFFPKPAHTFAPVVEGEQVLHSFILKNKGDKTLAVQKVKTG